MWCVRAAWSYQWFTPEADRDSNSKAGLIMASFPWCFPTIPSAVNMEPLRRPLMDRRPRNTSVIAWPLPSTRTHCNVGTSESGWTRTVFTLPDTFARVRHRNAEMGCASRGPGSV